MRCVVMIGLLLAGCAHRARPYTGTTHAQARWAAQLAWCRDYAAAPGPRDRRVLDRCRYDAEQATTEDAAERDAIEAQRQDAEDQDARERRRAFAESMRNYQPLPVQPLPTSTNCTSTAIGSTVYTNCH